ncbi:hypothetical protein M9H77_18767 [Catharanthus roseus]|uniref:Uncharacterized protein n=1 Tax=Catharanthus roseus TaxID=4058 RepID=A0ACC0B8C0_CATRO|nr:hypothetical protein M9H77_18767 [Catharanthus roseus]
MLNNKENKGTQDTVCKTSEKRNKRYNEEDYDIERYLVDANSLNEFFSRNLTNKDKEPRELKCPPKMKTMKRKQDENGAVSKISATYCKHWKQRPTADGRLRPTIGGRVVWN